MIDKEHTDDGACGRCGCAKRFDAVGGLLVAGGVACAPGIATDTCSADGDDFEAVERGALDRGVVHIGGGAEDGGVGRFDASFGSDPLHVARRIFDIDFHEIGIGVLTRFAGLMVDQVVQTFVHATVQPACREHAMRL